MDKKLRTDMRMVQMMKSLLAIVCGDGSASCIVGSNAVLAKFG